MACAKLWHDFADIILITIKMIFSRFKLWVHKLIVKWILQVCVWVRRNLAGIEREETMLIWEVHFKMASAFEIRISVNFDKLSNNPLRAWDVLRKHTNIFAYVITHRYWGACSWNSSTQTRTILSYLLITMTAGEQGGVSKTIMSS